MRIPLRALLIAFSAVSSASLLTGCGSGSGGAPIASSASVAGNWNFAAASAPASNSQIASVGGGGYVSSSGTPVILLHTAPVAGQSASSLCYAPASTIVAMGQTYSDGTIAFTSNDFAGNKLVVKGYYIPAQGSAPGSLRDATYSITGQCGVAVQTVKAVQMLAIGGSYTGTFVSDSGTTIPVSATLTQSSTPNTAGAYQLTGTATFPKDSCVGSPVVVASSVTGSAFSATYTDAATQATVTATGTLDSGANTLTITNYTLTGKGACNDTGHGTLSK